ncbi:MAG TPA: branched-chain amino acid ABC transporter substrate-binding protein [Chloroflexota bacterium]|nr:branched-chain amino acid ABC transporter substrate-binding protein [Chloroflexota bacterium]
MLVSACSQPSAAPSGGATVKIVSSLPRTGSSKGQTDTIVNGIKMALSEANNKAGSFTIQYDDLDDATAAKGSWDAGKEADNANKAVSDPQVIAYIGTFNSGAAAISIPILCKAGLAMISPANTAVGLTKPGKGQPDEPDKYYPGCPRNYMRVVPADDLQGSAAANWAKSLGVKNAYVLDDQELYGHGLSTIFVDTARKIGLTIVGGPEGIDPKASDYRALAQKIRAANPDLVYFGGITQNNAGKLLQDLKAAMPDVKFMGPDGIYEKAFIDAAGPAAEGAYITFGGVPPSKLTGKGADWYKRYKDQYKAEPEAYAAYGYEAAKVVLDAIARAGKADRAAVRDAMIHTKDFDGVLGKWSFDANGDTTLSTLSGRQVKNGAFDDANAVLLEAS